MSARRRSGVPSLEEHTRRMVLVWSLGCVDLPAAAAPRCVITPQQHDAGRGTPCCRFHTCDGSISCTSVTTAPKCCWACFIDALCLYLVDRPCWRPAATASAAAARNAGTARSRSAQATQRTAVTGSMHRRWIQTRSVGPSKAVFRWTAHTPAMIQFHLATRRVWP